MTGEPLIVGGVVLGAVFLLTTAFRHGHRHGEIAGMAKALQILEDHNPLSPGPLHFSPPTDATPDQAFAWYADFSEQGGEYADGQHAFRRSRSGLPAPGAEPRRLSEAQIAEAVKRSFERLPKNHGVIDCWKDAPRG